MKFGKVDRPELIDFTLPETHSDTESVLSKTAGQGQPKIHVGCPSWNKTNLKGFYPRGTKDELEYYSRQFNGIELNATFYRNFPAVQFEKWHEKTPDNFKFFPKLGQEISHWKRLVGVGDVVNSYIDNFSNLREKLGTVFLQLPSNFGPTNGLNLLENFVMSWPKGLPLAVECRHEDWFRDKGFADAYSSLLKAHNVANVLVDTAGRRDMMHMRLTNNEAFIRFVGANHPLDFQRLDSWVIKLKEWVELGLTNIHFFVHQNIEKEIPLLSSYFIEKLNNSLGTQLKIPNEDTNEQLNLF
jgi:uncharacterized protein YecE (DUF72 family)